ncbi:MAG: hypothetical protein WCO18_00285 [bacterium]
MKNYIKKIITLVAFTILLSGSNVLASVSWNTDPYDCPGSAVGNATTNVGIPTSSADCWTLTNVSASSGQNVNVQLWYHNTGNQPATNTKVFITVSPAIGVASTVHTFTSSLTSNQGGIPLGTTQVTLSSPQALIPGTTIWYANQGANSSTSSAQVILSSSGLSLGTINQGWSAQGATVTSFTVGTSVPPPNCTINSNLTAYPTSINSGGSSSLNWGTTNCTSTTVTGPNFNSTSSNGPQTVYPPTAAGSYKYTLNASGANGSVSPQDVYITVLQPLTCTLSINANPTSISSGGSSVLNWSSTSGCSSVSVAGPNFNSSNPNGSQSIFPPANAGQYTYTISASGPTGTYVPPSSTTITVNSLPVTTGTLSASSSSCVIASNASTCSIPFTWNTVNPAQGAISAVTHNSITVATGNSGSQSFNISNGTQTYYLYNNAVQLDQTSVSASCVSGTSWNGNLCSQNIAQNCSINSFTINNQNSINIQPGTYATLAWSTTNCTSSVSITGTNGFNATGQNGSQQVYFSQASSGTYTYTINASGPNNTATSQSVTAYVTPVQICTLSITANPTSISSGGSSVLNWSSTSGCSSVSVAGPNFNSSNPNGSQSIFPPANAGQYTYTISASGPTGTYVPPSSTTITVNSLPVTTGTLSASSSSCVIASNASTCSIPFTWNTVNPAQGAISAVTHNSITVATGNSGSQSFNISNGTQTYYLYNNAVQLDQTSVSASCVSGTSWNGNLCSQNIAQNCSINSFTINNQNSINIQPGTYATLAWSTTNCTSSVSITGTNGFNATGQNGSQQVYFSQASSGTYTYTINASGPNNTATSQSVSAYITPTQICTISNFTASPTYINSGGSSTLNWNTNNCTSVNISNLNYNVPVSGSQPIYPTYTTTYTLTAYGNNGSPVTQSVAVTVNNNQYNNCTISNFSASPTYVNSGSSSVLNWSTNNCSSVSISPNIGTVNNYQNGYQTVYPTYTTTYTLTAYGNNGSPVTQSVTVTVNNYQYNTCAISSFYATPTTVNYGGLATLYWATTGTCSSVSISNIGSVNAYSGSQPVYPISTTTYTITAIGSNGTYVSPQYTTVTVNNYVPPPTPIYNTCAVTGIATNISQNSVTLNGLVSNSSTYNGNTYFEYGTDVTLGNQTVARSIGSNTIFNEILTGLSPKTIYYYRLVSNCNNTISRGSIEIFQTSGTTTTTTTTIIRQGTTVIGTESPIMLKIENKYQSFRVGDSVDYTITYKNISNKTLTHPVLQVILPRGVAFLNSSRGTYSSDSYTVTVSLEDLVSNVEGVVYVQGRVDSIDSGNAQIVTTALLVYTAKNGAQENAMAYVLNNPITTSTGFGLGAAALFGSMFGMGIIGWMILLILILLAILLFRKVYRKQN